MKIKMIDCAVGPEVHMMPGKTYDVADEFGKALVAGKHAVRVDVPAPAPKPAPVKETADAKPEAKGNKETAATV